MQRLRRHGALRRPSALRRPGAPGEAPPDLPALRLTVVGLAILGAGTLGIAASSTLGDPAVSRPDRSAPAHRDGHRGPVPNAAIASFAPETTSITITAAGEMDFAGVADPRSALAPVRNYSELADLALCRLAPPPPAADVDRVAQAIGGAGFDSCSTAGAEPGAGPDSADLAGTAGLGASGPGAGGARSALDRAGVGSFPPSTGTTPASIETQTVRGAQVALLAYLDSPGLDADAIVRDAELARRGGADLVIVQMTWGEPGRVAPTDRQRILARRLLAAPDVDLVLGAGAGVVQPIEHIGGRYVAYGLGTLIGGAAAGQNAAAGAAGGAETTGAGRDGLLLTVQVRRTALGWWVAGLSYTPVWADPREGRGLPIADALDDPHTSRRTRTQLGAAWQRMISTVTALGSSDGVKAERSPRDPTGEAEPAR